MEKINRHQLFCLVIMGQIGSTNIWALGIEAKQDAWIVVVLSMLAGLGLIWLFTELSGKFPDDNIAGISVKLLGKVVGWPLAFIYFLLYIFNATRNASEFGDLINMTFLQETPRYVIIAIFLATIIYILFLGIETFARITEIIMPITLILIILVYFMVVISGYFDISQLSPVLGDGVKPILKTLYPVGINFPFGLGFVFIQFWRYADSREYVRKTTIKAVIISGLLLSVTLIIMVCSLGSNFAAVATIPYLEVIKLINIGDIISNLDAIGVILIFIGGFYLATLHFFSAVLILSYLFNVSNYKWLLIPIGVFILWYTGVYEPNYAFHVKFLDAQFWQQFVPLYNIAPVLLLLIYLLKSKTGKLKTK